MTKAFTDQSNAINVSRSLAPKRRQLLHVLIMNPPKPRKPLLSLLVASQEDTDTEISNKSSQPPESTNSAMEPEIAQPLGMQYHQEVEENVFAESQPHIDVPEPQVPGEIFSGDTASLTLPNRGQEPTATSPRKRPRRTGMISSHFPPSPAKKASPSPKKPRASPGTVSCLPFPVLTAPSFGLIQEKLAHDDFQLLIAVALLNKTKGRAAIPVCFKLLDRWPSPTALAHANEDDVYDLLQPLGLGSRRTDLVLNMARTWIQQPPLRDVRFRTPNYPTRNSSKGIRPHEVLNDADPREGAFEIAHLPGVGDYALDSWRIFCRDRLRGVALGFDGEGREGDEDFEAEWKRVLPQDKELRAFLRWMWLREGWQWDPDTGEKNVATEEVMREAMGGDACGVGEDEALVTGSNGQTRHITTENTSGEAFSMPIDLGSTPSTSEDDPDEFDSGDERNWPPKLM